MGGGASLIALLIKNPPAMQETLVQFLGQEDHWRRDRLPTPVFLGFPCGSAGKESAYNEGNLGSIPGLGRSISVFWPGEFHRLYSPWDRKESDMTGRISLSLQGLGLVAIKKKKRNSALK